MTNPNFENISATQAHEWLKTGQAILIDVREPDEFKAEHIAYATSIPLQSVPQTMSLIDPAGKKVIFQCLKGRRGESACEIFKPQSPATPLYNIAGGITAWKEAGLPVITAGGVGNAGASCGCGVPIFRQVQMVVGLVIAAFVALGYMGFTIGFALAGLAGILLFIAGATGFCALAMALMHAPWNKSGSKTGSQAGASCSISPPQK